MSKYTITIEGDFEKGDCSLCPFGELSFGGFICGIDIENTIACPLEEVKQGEWIKLTEVELDELDGAKVGYKCSACGASITGHDIDNLEAVEYCFYCGIPMKGSK